MDPRPNDRLRRDKENLFSSNGRMSSSSSSSSVPRYSQQQQQQQQHSYSSNRPSSPSSTRLPTPHPPNGAQHRGVRNPFDQREREGDVVDRLAVRHQNSRGGSYDEDRFGRGGGRGGGDGYGGAFDDRRINGVSARNATAEDVDYVKGQIKSVKQQSLQSTRNMMRLVTDAEATATNTLNKLGAQSETLNKVESRMDVSQIHAESASDRSAHLKSLNRSMFLPHMKNPFTSKKRAEAKIKKVEAEHMATQSRRDQLRSQQETTRDRIQNGMSSGRNDDRYGGGGARAAEGGSSRDYSRYQFEADDEDERTEREIGDHMDNVENLVGRLKGMAVTMRSEIGQQNEGIDRLSGKADTTGATIAGSSARLRGIR